MKSGQIKKNQSAQQKVGLILLAHGSRSEAWRKPFDRLLKDVEKRGSAPAVLAFGEFMSPNLLQAAQQFAQRGVTRATVVPLFLGGGAHVRSDTPRLAREAQAASGVKLNVVKAIGEDAGVLAAMARYCVAQARPRKTKKPIKSNT